MRDKYQNKTPIMRFFHKYTGFIVVGVSIAILAPWIAYSESQVEFFERWPCNIINGYVLVDNNDGNPSYADLTPEQLEKFHVILDECNNEPFTPDQLIPEVSHKKDLP